MAPTSREPDVRGILSSSGCAGWRPIGNFSAVLSKSKTFERH